MQRLLLLVMAVGLALAAVSRRDRRPTHAAQLANAGGVALAAIAAGPLAAGLLRGAIARGRRRGPHLGAVPAVGWGWEVPLLIGGFGLLAYGAVDRQRGPVLVGLLGAGGFVASSAGDGRQTLLGWPVVLAVAAAFMLVVGLRPTTPAPPEPARRRASPAPARSRCSGPRRRDVGWGRAAGCPARPRSASRSGTASARTTNVEASLSWMAWRRGSASGNR